MIPGHRAGYLLPFPHHSAANLTRNEGRTVFFQLIAFHNHLLLMFF